MISVQISKRQMGGITLRKICPQATEWPPRRQKYRAQMVPPSQAILTQIRLQNVYL